MLVYQEFPQNYKSESSMVPKRISDRQVKVSTSKSVLKRKNIKFLSNLGLKVKK